MVLALAVIENAKNTGPDVSTETPGVSTGMVGVFTGMAGVFTANLNICARMKAFGEWFWETSSWL